MFGCSNQHFAAIMRLILSCDFSLLFSRKRSNPSPPNFMPPCCALCLIVYDFLPKTWNLGRKNTPAASSPSQAEHPFRLLPLVAATFPKGTANPLSHRCAMPAPPKGELNSLSPSLTALTAPSGREPLAKPHTLQFNRKLSIYAKGSPFGRAVTKGD